MALGDSGDSFSGNHYVVLDGENIPHIHANNAGRLSDGGPNHRLD